MATSFPSSYGPTKSFSDYFVENKGPEVSQMAAAGSLVSAAAFVALNAIAWLFSHMSHVGVVIPIQLSQHFVFNLALMWPGPTAGAFVSALATPFYYAAPLIAGIGLTAFALITVKSAIDKMVQSA